MKQRDRAKRHWPQHGDIDVDYATGRQLTGSWKALPSLEPREPHDKPLAGGPVLKTLQFDATLAPDEHR